MIFLMNFTIINSLSYGKYSDSFTEEIILISSMFCILENNENLQ